MPDDISAFESEYILDPTLEKKINKTNKTIINVSYIINKTYCQWKMKGH